MVAIEESILISTKQKLGLGKAHTDFDEELVDHINSAFFRVNQLGIGPVGGFMIEGEDEEWSDFDLDGLNVTVLNALKTYVQLKVRLVFDPPTTSHHISMIQEQVTELEHTLLTERGLLRWTAPSSSPYLP